jgi:autotransporter-associated beta strand protein
VFVRNGQEGTTEAASLRAAYAPALGGSGHSEYTSVNSDGRYVAFTSAASNLVAGDTNGSTDIFVKDRTTGSITRVSTDSAGAQANSGSSGAPSISSDGRYVAFRSDASNLVAGDTNGQSDIFVKDRTTGITTRVSTDSAGAQATGPGSDGPSISSDGRYVAFSSDASNLVAGDTNGQPDIFVKDRTTGSITRVSTDSAGAQATGGMSFSPSISSDGRYVAFSSSASNLVAGDTNGFTDIFVKDRATGSITRVSTDSAGAQATGGHSNVPSISSDGRYVAFPSDASNLVAGDTNGLWDIFVKDRTTGSITRVSTDSAGAQATGGHSARASISSDGRYVAFRSLASDLYPYGLASGSNNIFCKANPLMGTLPLSGIGAIYGAKYSDRDADGTRDEDELGIEGWTLILDTDGDGSWGSNEPVTVTDAAGNYSFTALPFSLYTVREASGSAWKPVTAQPITLGLPAGISPTATGVDFGNFHVVDITATAGGQVVAAPVPEGTLVIFTAVAGSGFTATSHSWSVKKNGQPYTLPNGTVTDQETFSFILPDGDASASGTRYTATVVVTGPGGPYSDSADVWVVNVAPQNVSAGGSYTIGQGQDATFTATATDLDPLTYFWDINGDGLFDDAAGSSVTLTWAQLTALKDAAGNYLVTTGQSQYLLNKIKVRVSDEDGGVTDSAVTSLTINNRPPVVSIGNAPATPEEGTSISLAGQATDPGNDPIASYAWTVTKDNATYSPPGLVTNQQNFSFTPDDEGTYRVTFTATDQAGESVTTPTTTIVVANAKPTVAILNAPARINEGVPIRLTSLVTDPGNDPIASYMWTLKLAGATVASGTAPDFAFTPASEGTYVVTFTATDNGGLSATAAERSIEVTNRILQGTSGDDTIVLVSNSIDPNMTDVVLNGTLVWSVRRDSFTAFQVLGGPGSDELTVDFSRGNPLPGEGVWFDGSQGEALRVKGTGGADTVTVDAAQIILAGTPPIHYGSAEFFAFDLGAGADNLVLDSVTLRINRDNAISDGTAVTIDNGILDLGGRTETVSAVLLRSGSIVNGTLLASPVVVQAGSISTGLTGVGKLTKSGTGTLVLTAASSYKGGTEVSGGTLLVTHADALPPGGDLVIGGGATVVLPSGLILTIAGAPPAAAIMDARPRAATAVPLLHSAMNIPIPEPAAAVQVQRAPAVQVPEAKSPLEREESDFVAAPLHQEVATAVKPELDAASLAAFRADSTLATLMTKAPAPVTTKATPPQAEKTTRAGVSSTEARMRARDAVLQSCRVKRAWSDLAWVGLADELNGRKRSGRKAAATPAIVDQVLADRWR